MSSALALLADWLPRQRWFTVTAHPPRLRVLADVPIDQDHGDDTRVRVLIVADDAAPRPLVYQIPLVERSAASPAPPGAVIGAIDGRVLIDGPHDPAFTAALLRAVAPALTDAVSDAPAEVLRGEQSNTSIIFRPCTGAPIICKVFRQLNEGLNPDIELQSALAGAGSRHVPAVVGALEGTWDDPTGAGDRAGGSLAFAQEFFPGVQDAWRAALRAAEADEDFRVQAEALGRATADVHRDLARLFPAPAADDAARAAITDAWERRLSIAVAEVPQLLAHQTAIRARYADGAAAAWPALQRIHGDYHLGQVLDVPGRGWILLDFEGEPMRPMPERRLPDLALRDIAGMLRSFDYVAGSLATATMHAAAAEGRTTDAAPSGAGGAAGRVTPWAAAARTAFLAGYAGAAGVEPAGPLLDALELDKAVYEAIYESRHRPGWLPIPLAAIDRLVTR